MPNQSKRLGVKTLDPNLLAYITQLAHKAGLAVTRAEKHYDTRITVLGRTLKINGKRVCVSRPTCTEGCGQNLRIAAGSMSKSMSSHRFALFIVDVQIKGETFKEIYTIPKKDYLEGRVGPRIRIPLTEGDPGSPALQWQKYRGVAGLSQIKEEA